MEVDDSWFGRQRHGSQRIVVGAIERGTKRLRLQIIPDTAQDSREEFICAVVTPQSLLVTDTRMGYSGIEYWGYGRP